ncbi:hypothetical protein TNCV_1868461 [Trichonephila clavipes]|nr:hypothetical protein TNCV_1868461 [Trichonephila clavipes]
MTIKSSDIGEIKNLLEELERNLRELNKFPTNVEGLEISHHPSWSEISVEDCQKHQYHDELMLNIRGGQPMARGLHVAHLA